MNDWMLIEDEPEVLADRFEGFQIAAGPQAPGLELGQVTVRLSNPGEVAAAVPHFFGFAPDYSVVLLGLTPHGLGGRAALCHGMRVDLDVVERHPSRFARWAANRMLDEGAVESLILIYPRFGAPAIPGMHQRLSTLLCAQLRKLGPRPLDSLFIAGGRWWSFLCEKPDCCPLEGTAINPAASEVAALSTYSGLVVLPSRAALAQSLQPYPTDTVERTRAACVALADERSWARQRAQAEAAAQADASAPVAVAAAGAGAASPAPGPAAAAAVLAPPVNAEAGPLLVRQREAVHDRLASYDPSYGPSSTHGGAATYGRGSAPGPSHDQGTGYAYGPGYDGEAGYEPYQDRIARLRAIDPSEGLLLDWAEVRELWALADRLGGEIEGPGWQLEDEQAARLLLGLTDVRVRDYLATWCATERAGQAVALAVELARRAVTAEQAAAGYSVAAWAAWALGWGAWASLTLERALAAVPDYSLAVLIQTGLTRGVGPSLVRVASHGTGQRLAGMAQEQG